MASEKKAVRTEASVRSLRRLLAKLGQALCFLQRPAPQHTDVSGPFAPGTGRRHKPFKLMGLLFALFSIAQTCHVPSICSVPASKDALTCQRVCEDRILVLYMPEHHLPFGCFGSSFPRHSCCSMCLLRLERHCPPKPQTSKLQRMRGAFQAPSP